MKMKKNVLSAAVLAALGVGSAQAVNMSQTGTGEALIYPYFTVQEGNDTLISVVNTTAHVKGVKVRFREALNSREILDFHVWLSPYDVWTASIKDDGNGGGMVQTNDNSCAPTSLKTGVPFRTSTFDGTDASWPVDGAGTTRARTREGYLEILEMGWGEPTNAILANAVHTTAGVPVSCSAISAAVASGTIQGALSQPSGGLFGGGAIIHVADGAEIDTPVTTLEDVFNVVVYGDTGNEAPNLGQAETHSLVLLNNGDALTDNPGDSPVAYNDLWLEGIDAVSAVIMAQAVMNEFSVNPDTEANSALVITFPTKRYYADPAVEPAAPVLPFTERFYVTACEDISISIWNREEAYIVPEVDDISPRPPTPGLSICYEANVINFNDGNLLDTSHPVQLATPFPNGWLRIGFSDEHVMGGAGRNASSNVYYGLPDRKSVV